MGLIIRDEACRLFGFNPVTTVHRPLIVTVEIVDIIYPSQDHYESLHADHLVPEGLPSGKSCGLQLVNTRLLAQPSPMRGQLRLLEFPDDIIELTRVMPDHEPDADTGPGCGSLPITTT